MKQWIGLTGKGGVGKDTVADILVEQGFTKVSFAGPIKEALAILGIVEPASREAKELPLEGCGYSYRLAAQSLGTEWARSLDKDFWIKLAKSKAEGLEKVVFSDVRFDNEAEMIRLSGSIWHVIGRGSTVLGSSKYHASEAGVLFYPNSDQLVENSAGLPELRVRVLKLLKGE